MRGMFLFLVIATMLLLGLAGCPKPEATDSGVQTPPAADAGGGEATTDDSGE